MDGHYNDQTLSAKGGNLWRMDLDRSDAKPVRLPDAINASDSTFSPAVAADGTLWFMRSDGGKFHIFHAAFRGETYSTPAPAPFTDAHFGDYDPAVAPDGSFVIFSSSALRSDPATQPDPDLFITFRTKAGWTKPLSLRKAMDPAVHGVEARLSPDVRTLYFSNSAGPAGTLNKADTKATYIWRVPLDVSRLRGLAGS